MATKTSSNYGKNNKDFSNQSGKAIKHSAVSNPVPGKGNKGGKKGK